jgi:hypothetical protein
VRAGQCGERIETLVNDLLTRSATDEQLEAGTLVVADD